MGNSKRKRTSRTAGKRRSRQTTSKRTTSIWAVLGVLALLLMGYLIQQGYLEQYGIPADLLSRVGIADDGVPASAEPWQASGEIEVLFTTPYLIYPDEPEQRAPPPPEQGILADIEASQQSIDAALFEYNLESLAEALVRAHERGVTVRLALDRENLEDPDDAFWAGMVEEAGIPISWQETTAFQHSKFIILDGAVVWTGSWNATVNGTYRNNNNLLRLAVPAIAANYTTEFEQMMAGTFGSHKAPQTPYPVVTLDDTLIENYFAPSDGVAAHVIERLNSAQSSIQFMAFSFTSDEIAQAMLDRQQAGVTVQGVFENRSANGIGSEFDRLADGGAEVWTDGNCYTMHHKVIILDDSTVITGSYNFTQRAEDTNDENLLIIDNPTIAAQYMEEFERVSTQARNPTRCGR